MRTLSDWLAWQETLHPSTIALGLDRVAVVKDRLALTQPAPVVITVGGTNGKGSCVAMLEAIYRAAGYRTGAYTSPHLLRYNERIRVNGVDVDDDELCASFARIDDARGDISLTYFEFGTLAALEIFARTDLDVAILEVGLGGRLDAVNIVDADVALITTIGIDHTEYLGPDRESIGFEKAGILRADRPAVCGDPDPPQSLRNYAQQLNATLYCYQRDFRVQVQAEGWTWSGLGQSRPGMPQPRMRGEYQLQNAASVLAVVQLLQEKLPAAQSHIREGLSSALVPGRFQYLPTKVPTILDVAHNPHAAEALAQTLRAQTIQGRTLAVFGMLKDKDIAGVVRALAPCVAEWHCISLPGPRGAQAWELATMLQAGSVSGLVILHSDIEDAYAAATAAACAQDRIVVFGSFYTVAGLLAMGIIKKVV